MADWYVDPNAAGENNGTTWGNAYTSLQAAETAKNANITGAGPITFHCKSSAGSADVKTIFTGWTTTADDYILVQGGYAAGETGTPGTPLYPGKYSTSYYHVEAIDTDSNVYVQEDYVRVDKILSKAIVTTTGYAFRAAGINATNNDLRFSDCIAVGVCSGTGIGRGFYDADPDSILTFVNCIAYGFYIAADLGFGGYQLYGTIDLYNCLAYGNTFGIQIGAGTATCYNCVSFNNENDFVGTVTLYECASDDNDAENHAGNEVDATWSTDFLDAANGDFTLLVGSPLIGGGDTGLAYGGTSINGVARGVAWDIGPWEYVAAGGLSIPVAKHVRSLSPNFHVY